MKLIGIVGVTNSGKTTLLDHLRNEPWVGMAEIGKEMRKRYPPSHFKGRGAMKETEAEVWEIFKQHHQEAVDRGCQVLLCDGQPRLPEQVGIMRRRYGPVSLLQLYAPLRVLCDRAARRDAEPEALELSWQRLTNDYVQLYQVLAEWHMDHSVLEHFAVVDTKKPPHQWLEEACRFIASARYGSVLT